MANIDYEKIGWNSSTSLGPTNFGHMDDGIKAACDKLDNIGDEVLGARVVSQGPQHEVINADNATTALNDSLGHNIAEQFSQVNNTLTVLGNNIGNLKFVHGRVTVTTNASGGFNVNHNGGFSGDYICNAVVNGNDSSFVTCDSNTSNSSFCVLHNYQGQIKANTQVTINYVAIGV